MVNINPKNLIQFVNLVNECCAVMDDNYVSEWLLTPNSNLDNKRPFELTSTKKGRIKLLKLLRFIEIDEADLF